MLLNKNHCVTEEHPPCQLFVSDLSAARPHSLTARHECVSLMLINASVHERHQRVTVTAAGLYLHVVKQMIDFMSLCFKSRQANVLLT